MSSNHLNLEEAHALGDDSQATFEQSDSMKQSVQMLFAEIEEVTRALRGGSGEALKESIGLLGESFSGLLSWCSRNGMDMSEAHGILMESEEQSTEHYMQQAQAIGGITRNVN